MAKKDTGPFTAELLDSLLAGRDPKTLLDSGGLIGELKKALAELMLSGPAPEIRPSEEAEAGRLRGAAVLIFRLRSQLAAKA